MKRFLLILLAICTVFALGQTAFADDGVTFEYVNWWHGHDYDISSNVSESARMAIDGNKLTKMRQWGYLDPENIDSYLEFRASEGILVSGYTLTSADNSLSKPESNPKSWELYGKNMGGEWVLIDTVVNDEQLGTANSGDFYYEAESNGAFYKYYMLLTTANHGGGDVQLAEITLSYTRCSHSWDANYVCTECLQPAVATANENFYVNLKEALNAAENYSTVKIINDCYMDEDYTIYGKNLTLDLNGHVVELVKISNNRSTRLIVDGAASLTVMDGNPTATHSDAAMPNGGFMFTSGNANNLIGVHGTLTLIGGSFQSTNDAALSAYYGGTIVINDGASIVNSKYGIKASGKVIMNGGNITGSASGSSNRGIIGDSGEFELYMNGGTISGFRLSGIGMYENSEMYMSGGVIKNCGTGIYIDEDDVTVELSGNAVIENCSEEKGGGIWCCDDECKITLKGNATIKNCSAKLYGGGIYIGDDENTLIIKDNAKIIDCTAGRYGGGVYIENDSSSETNVFVMSDSAVIENCKAENSGNEEDHLDAFGGGIYLTENVDFTIKDNASVKNCKAVSANGNAYGDGIYFGRAYNSKGTVIKANGGTVENSVYIEAQNESGSKPAGIIKCTDSAVTNFLAGAENHGTISGGIYYGSCITGDGIIEGKTITFMNGNDKYAVEVVAEGNTSVKPIDPKKTDYAFVAWYTEKECKNEYKFDSAVDNDITLYAGYIHTNHSDEEPDHYCDVCGEKFSDHDFSIALAEEKYIASSADCTHKATYYYSCACGEHGTETFEHGEAIGHNLGKWIYNRESHWKKCARCGELFEHAEHSFTEWDSVYGEKNKEVRHCTVCGHEQFASTISIGTPSVGKKPVEEQNPNTGAPVMTMAPLALVLGAAVLIFKHRV